MIVEEKIESLIQFDVLVKKHQGLDLITTIKMLKTY